MIKLKRRIGSAFLACMMLLSLLPVTALAIEPKTTTVNNATELVNAIKNANSGDVIQLKENTTYTLTKSLVIDESVTIQGASGAVIDGSNSEYPVYGDNDRSAYCFN